MMLARDEYIFLLILLVNLIVSVIYLLAGVFVLVPAHALAADEEQEERLYDNRRTYLIRFIVMILCPVIVPLFFFMGHICYLVIFWKNADLADVNEKKDLRMVLMNVMQKDISNSLASITLALESEDSETSHYAAAVLSDELNRFRLYVQKLRRQICEEEAEETECEEMLLDYMDNILKQHIFSDHEQRKFVHIMEETAESLYEKDHSRITLKQYESVCLRIMEMKEFEASGKWCMRMAEQYPGELLSYTCKLKYYFASQNREAFFTALDELKKSDVVIDSETLELIRIFS